MDKRSGIRAWKQIGVGGFLGNVAGSRQSVRGILLGWWLKSRLKKVTVDTWHDSNAETNCSSLSYYLPGACDQIDTCGITPSSRTWMSCNDLNSWTCPEWPSHLGPWHRWRSPSGVALNPSATGLIMYYWLCHENEMMYLSSACATLRDIIKKNQMPNPIHRTHKSVISVRVLSNSLVQIQWQDWGFPHHQRNHKRLSILKSINHRWWKGRPILSEVPPDRIRILPQSSLRLKEQVAYMFPWRKKVQYIQA